MNAFYLILISLLAYLIGSFPTAYLLVKKLSGKDIKKVGSGNIGAMNTVRALKEKSKKLAIAGFLTVLIVDMAKGALAVFLAQKLFFHSPDLYYFSLILATFFVILGHNYSVFLKFAGGRGAASLIGILLYLNIFSLVIWGLSMAFFTILAQLVLEKISFEEKINWRKIPDIISILGKQMAGRMVGLIFAPFFIILLDPQIFSLTAIGTVLLLIKNSPRFKDYFEKGEMSND